MRELQHLRKTLGEERAARERALLAGAPKDFPEYKHLAGVIQGLTLAENHLTDLVQKLEKADE
jgi:hypothetical protein